MNHYIRENTDAPITNSPIVESSMTNLDRGIFFKRGVKKIWVQINQNPMITRRLCVLANTKLYHRNLLLWISMKFWILVSTTLGLFSKDPPIHPNTHTKLTKIKIKPAWGQIYNYLNIYLVINWSILSSFVSFLSAFHRLYWITNRFQIDIKVY